MSKLPILLLQLVLSGYVLSSKMNPLKLGRNREMSRNFKTHQERRSVQSQTVDHECYHANDGSDYRGNVSVTADGFTCLKWTDPNAQWQRINQEKFPYGGLGEHNYCRNPDNFHQPWCFNTGPDLYGVCDIGQPAENCETGLIVNYLTLCEELWIEATDDAAEFAGGHADFWIFEYVDAPGPSDPLPRPHRVVQAVKERYGGVSFDTAFPTEPWECLDYLTIIHVYNADESSSVKVSSLQSSECYCDYGSGYGDPHYKTFDGIRFNYNGDCTYLLAKDCYNKTATFEIFAKHGSVPNTSARRVDMVIIKTRGQHKGHELTINHKNTVTIDSEVVTSDVHRDTGEAGMTYERTEEGVHYVWPQEGDWQLKYTSHHSKVAIECRHNSSLTGNTCGLLGNNNGDKTDDLMKADGSMAADFDEVGDSYAVPKSCPP